MKSPQSSIIKSIRARTKDRVLFVDAFENFGSSTAVRQAFSRLHKAGIIVRIANGIYYYPNKLNDKPILIPEIAEEIAKRDKAKILPTASYAQYVLGLSTQLPTNYVFITNGTPRTIHIGDNTIKFKRATAKNFAFKSKLLYLIVVSLKAMFDKPNNIQENIIRKHLINIPEDQFKHDIDLAPYRIKMLLKKLRYN